MLKTEQNGSYSNITLNSVFSKYEVDERDKKLTSALYYGVLDRKITVDYILKKFIKTPIKKISPYTLAVLRCGIYQICFMDKIPESAAVNESVNLIKNSSEKRNAGFVNAVLRNVIRNGYKLPDDKSISSMSVIFSCPEWIIKSFTDDYGKENAEKILEYSLKPAYLSLRVNSIKTDCDTVASEFRLKGINCKKGDLENSLTVDEGFDFSRNELYKNGLFYAQDTASQTAVKALNPTPGSRVLDICAAPGGKTFTMAQYMENRGEIVACDLYQSRVKLIADGAKRLGINIISAKQNNAEVFDEKLGQFDFILCDVPCSGLGVLRRKPEIKYKPVTDLTELVGIQYKILTNAVRYLKKGGKILYSTCTLHREENENLVNRFLKEYNNFYRLDEHTFFPHIDGTDGFYYALLSFNNGEV